MNFPYSGVTVTTPFLTDSQQNMMLSCSSGNADVFSCLDENITKIRFDLSNIVKMDIEQFRESIAEVVNGFGLKVSSFELHYREAAN
jgi:hypothetical protein